MRDITPEHRRDSERGTFPVRPELPVIANNQVLAWLSSRWSQMPRLLRWFYFVVFAVLAAGISAHIASMSRITFTNHDDIRMDMIASEMRNQGASRYWTHAGGIAHGQGRVYFYFSLIFFILPFLTESEVVRAVMASGVQLLSYCAIALCLSLYFRPAIGALFLALIYVFLPEWSGHYPVTAYPVVYHTAYAMFFSGLSLWVCAQRFPDHFRRRRGYILAAAGTLLFFSYWIYEAVWVLFLAMSFTVALVEGWRRVGGTQGALRKAVRGTASSMPVLVLAVNVVFYGVFRRVFSTEYAGTTVSLHSATNIAGIWRALKVFALGALPSANYFLQANLVRLYTGSSIAQSGLVRHFLGHLDESELVQLVGLCALVPTLMAICWGNLAGPCGMLRKRGIWVAVFGTLIALVIPLPVAMTVKYQRDPLYSPYIPGYYAFVIWCVAMTGAIAAVSGAAVHWRRGAKATLQVGVTVAVVSLV